MRRLAILAYLLAPFAVSPTLAQSGGDVRRVDDLRCREAGFRSGTPAYARCRTGLERWRAGDRRPVGGGSSTPPPLDIIRPRGFSPPPVVATPPPVVVAPSLPDPPLIIDGTPSPPGVVPGPVPRVMPPPVILGPAAPGQSPGLLHVPVYTR